MTLFFTEGRFPGPLDLGQNLSSFSPPDVPFGIEVMPGEVLHDCVNQLGHPTKAAGQNRLLTQSLGKSAKAPPPAREDPDKGRVRLHVAMIYFSLNNQ